MTNIKGSYPCPVCNNDDYMIVYDMCDVKMNVSGASRIPGLVVRCRNCGMWYKILTKVKDDAYGEEFAGADYIDSYMAGDRACVFFRKVLRGIGEKSGRAASEPLRLLDIGTGLGAMVETAQEMGFDAEGIDMCEPLVQRAQARGLKVHCTAAEDFDRTETYDIVTMMDIIEHVPEPVKLLRSVHRMLKSGGKVVVYTPNYRDVVVELSRILYRVKYKNPARIIFGANHICFFDDRTLALALNNAGFEVNKSLIFPYFPLFMRKGMSISFINSIVISFIELFGVPFKRVFRLLYYAEKK